MGEFHRAEGEAGEKLTAPKKNPGKRGRKGRYETHVEPRLNTIKSWRRKGLIEKEICKNLGVSVACFAEYKNRYPELLEALKSGKSDADAQVENALFKRAVGYEYEEVEQTVTRTAKGQESPAARVKKVTKQIAPDVTAMIFYLKNRCSSNWHDRHGLEHSGPGGAPLSAGIVQIVLPDNGRGDATPPEGKAGE